ncbi:hypothetical protein GWI33_008156 [Rhynchophorus ferrugineus]|uniref:PWWP domain-containing protein n=1 Tax=Rhynchophorus ferrugineus TaxID=354439 RepID=A0A834MG41_RHYFE|nr:hypothetical protein GWI33_008156 [Rhynchophorus ferrugineus]
MTKVYNIGDKVFAKIKGYPPWPAKIESDTGKKKYNVTFYGTQEVGVIKAEDISYYLENKNNFVHKYLKRVGYNSAVKEIEQAIEEDGGDGSENAVLVDNSNTSVNTSITDKRGVKRKSTAGNDEVKKPNTKTRRKSTAVDVKESFAESEESNLKKAKKKLLKVETEAESETVTESPGKKVRRKSILSEKETTENTPSLIEGSGHNLSETDRKSTEIKEVKIKLSELEQPSETTDATVEDRTKENDQDLNDSADKENEILAVKSDIVTEQMLRNNLLYAEHVKKKENMYREKPVENRQDSKNQTFPVKLSSGAICGFLIHKDWPLCHSNEYERALYDAKVATLLFQLKDQVTSGDKKIEDVDSFKVVPDLRITDDELTEIIYTKDIESKKKRLARLKTEADLVTLDSKIKMSLGLDKALLDDALSCLEEFKDIERSLDALMFKKHPHVLETIRRLRKYVGNVREWKMDDKELTTFSKKAEKIRYEADKIYNSLMSIIDVRIEKNTFWDSFLEVVSEFRAQCKEFSDLDILVLCAEPNSRQAFLDQLDEITEPEVQN